MTEQEQIQQLVKRYIKAIHSQTKKEFLSLWTGKAEDTLISITNVYNGDETIYNDFFIEGIQKKYSRIDLIADSMKINLLDEKTAIVIFAYHTECTLRENGEPFGIKGLETQVVRKLDGQWKLQHIHYSK